MFTLAATVKHEEGRAQTWSSLCFCSGIVTVIFAALMVFTLLRSFFIFENCVHTVVEGQGAG
jgi:hypothetical protein